MGVPVPVDDLPGAAPVATPKNPAEFVQMYGDAANRAAQKLNVDPKALLAQWGLETGWGKSVIPGTNNLGNIKDFSGGGIAATDNMTGSRDKYRVFDTPDAFADHYADLISRKYKGVVGSGGDIGKFASGLVAGGYAEDPRYADKIQAAYRMVGNATNPIVRAGNAVTDAIIPTARAASRAVPADDLPDMPQPAKAVQPQGSRAFNTAAASLSGAAASLPGVAGISAKMLTPEGRASLAAQAKGVASGFADVGNTLLNLFDAGGNKLDQMIKGPSITQLVTGQAPKSDFTKWNEARNATLSEFNTQNAQGANGSDFGVGRIAGNVAATWPVGGALGQVVRGVPVLSSVPGIARALETGGMSTGLTPATFAGKVGNKLLSAGTGATVGGLSAGLTNPDSAKTGAIIGGAIPLGATLAGYAGKKTVNLAKSGINKLSGEISPEVKALANRAEELGINIPADRIADSKPMNAIASSLNYVPFSGRAATEAKMGSQLNQALSKTFGQDSSNVTMALRKAEGELGGKFDTFLQNNGVKVSDKFLNDLSDASTMATNELGKDGANIINKQIDEILAKAQNGAIDGQAAYNIKKTLDRIGNRNSPESWYALDLKRKLMDALNETVGPQAAKEFATLRQQYGNMLDLQKIAKNGAEGEISVARLANMKDIRNPQMQELADIAAQFVKAREGAHGAAQRAVIGGLTGYAAGLPALAMGAASGRAANSILNSGFAKNALLQNAIPVASGTPAVENALAKMLPLTYQVPNLISR